MTDNKVKLNDDKTEIMIISPSRMSTSLSTQYSFATIGTCYHPFTSCVLYSNSLLSGCQQSLILRLQNVQYNAAGSILPTISKHEDISLHLASPQWLSIDACIMYKRTCIYFPQMSSPRLCPSSGVAGMVMSNIIPLCSVQYVLLLNTKLSISILHVCMHVCTCAHTNARTQAHTHTRTHARTHARTQVRTYVPTFSG